MHPAPLVELASLFVLGIFVARELRLGRLGALGPLALTLVAGAWVAEDTCIRLYGFYQYHPAWSVFLDRMPAMVALIWPFVILSDREVVQGVLGEGDPRVPWVTGAWVVWDACLMETISVQAGLWSWNEPGFFGVPVIGVLGWGFYTAAALWLWGRLPGRSRYLTIVLAPLMTHGLLLAAWWGGLRWVLRGPFEAEAVIAAGGMLSLGLMLLLRRRRIALDLKVMGPRIPAALVFLVLLLATGREEPALMAFALTFVPPYLLATRWRSGGPRSTGLRQVEPSPRM